MAGEAWNSGAIPELIRDCETEPGSLQAASVASVPADDASDLDAEVSGLLDRFKTEIQSFVAPFTWEHRAIEANRQALREMRLAPKIKALCGAVEQAWEGVSLSVKDETQFGKGRSVFVRVRVEPTRHGFYVVPRANDNLVTFFTDVRRGPSWLHRMKRRMRSAGSSPYDDYYYYHYYQNRRKRQTVGTLSFQVAQISEADVFAWIKYACSGFAEAHVPSLRSDA